MKTINNYIFERIRVDNINTISKYGIFEGSPYFPLKGDLEWKIQLDRTYEPGTIKCDKWWCILTKFQENDAIIVWSPNSPFMFMCYINELIKYPSFPAKKLCVVIENKLPYDDPKQMYKYLDENLEKYLRSHMWYVEVKQLTVPSKVKTIIDTVRQNNNDI